VAYIPAPSLTTGVKIKELHHYLCHEGATRRPGKGGVAEMVLLMYIFTTLNVVPGLAFEGRCLQ